MATLGKKAATKSNHNLFTLHYSLFTIHYTLWLLLIFVNYRINAVTKHKKSSKYQ